MTHTQFTVDRTTADLAAEMIALFGKDAGTEAAMRANRSRDAGNAVRFCRWRMAERFIAVLADEQSVRTIH
jgi:hypothetical protein